MNVSKPVAVLSFVLGFGVLFANFQFNVFGIALQNTFDGWQVNGQARVLGGIVADIHGLEKQNANMGRVYFDLAQMQAIEKQQWTPTYQIFESYPSESNIVFEAYPTQLGIHQIAYSWAAQTFSLTQLSELQAIVAALYAGTLLVFSILTWRVYNGYLAALSFVFLAFMPYALTMARNLYWSPFLLLLPAIFAMAMYLSNSKVMKIAFLFGVVFAMYLKSASNYEYLTTVTLLACAPFLVAPYFDKSGHAQFGTAVAVWIACVAGFAIALLQHAGMRGETLIDGLRAIYVEDIARRTYGESGAFSGETKESLEASALDVLRIYLSEKYPGRREMIVPGKVFLGLIGVSVLGIIFQFLRRKDTALRDFMCFVVFFSVPVSWFVLAKGHSYTQTHINFVLWYFGFMPALFFVATNTARVFVTDVAALFAKRA